MFSSFGEFDIAGYKHGVNILKVNLAGVFEVLVQCGIFRALPIENDIVSPDFVPAWLENSFC